MPTSLSRKIPSATEFESHFTERAMKCTNDNNKAAFTYRLSRQITKINLLFCLENLCQRIGPANDKSRLSILSLTQLHRIRLWIHVK